jgi:hypothetical protein
VLPSGEPLSPEQRVRFLVDLAAALPS